MAVTQNFFTMALKSLRQQVMALLLLESYQQQQGFK
jgi:hypothetical protein